MAYVSTGLIEATDYNNFINGTNQLNTVWAVGTGDVGYGQTALTTVTSAGTITATQWATLINTVNSTLTHQAGTGSGISAVTAGSTINYLSALGSSINTAYTNRLNKASTGATITGGTFSPNFTAPAQAAASTWNFTRTITFASGDAARYFFNAGGSFNFVTISMANNDGAGRSTDWCTLCGTYLGNYTGINYTTNSGRSGTGGTLNTNNTSIGYYDLGAGAQTLSSITSTNYPYSGDYVTINIRSSGNSGVGRGNVIYLDFTVYSGALTDAAGAKTINVTWNQRIDIVPPETTNLTNSWGTITIG
jgi:hypothetical protein